MLHAKTSRETDKSVLVIPQDFTYDGDLWIPKSAIEPDGIVNDFFCRKYKGLTGALQIAQEQQEKGDNSEPETGTEDTEEVCNILPTGINKPTTPTQQEEDKTEPHTTPAPQDTATKLKAQIHRTAIVLDMCLLEGAQLEAKHYRSIDMTDAERVEVQRKLGTTIFINQ